MEKEHAAHCSSLSQEANECNCYRAYGFASEEQLQEAHSIGATENYARWKLGQSRLSQAEPA